MKYKYLLCTCLSQLLFTAQFVKAEVETAAVVISRGNTADTLTQHANINMEHRQF